MCKGLEDVIGLSATHPTWQRTRPNDPKDEHWGWTFASEEDAPFENANGQPTIRPRCCSSAPHVFFSGYKYTLCFLRLPASCTNSRRQSRGGLSPQLSERDAGQGKLKPKTGLLPDTVNHVKNIRDLYDKSGGTAGTASHM